MRKSFSLFLLFLIFSSFYFSTGQKDVVWPPLAKAAGPILGLEESAQTNLRSWDFGKVKAGQILKHTFVYKNEGKAIVKLKSTNTSCSCTVSAIKNRELLPGESSDIDITFNSKGYNGKVKQFVYLNTDSQADAIVRFEINAEVEN